MGRWILTMFLVLVGCAKKPSDADLVREKFSEYVRCTSDARFAIDVRKSLQNCLYTNGFSDSLVATSSQEQETLNFARDY